MINVLDQPMPSPPSGRAGPAVLYAGCALVIWSYILSVYIYKVWYIVTILAVLMTGVMVLCRQIRTARFIVGMSFVSLYFWYLLLTSFWAFDPPTTTEWVAIDSIQIAVFGLFYLLGTNTSPIKSGNFLQVALFGGCLATSVLWIRHPDAIMISRAAPIVLACLLPFALINFRPHHRLKSLCIFSLSLGLIIVGGGRAALIAVLIGSVFASFAVTQNVSAALRFTGLMLVSFLLTTTLLFSVPATRLLAARTFTRVTNRSVQIDNKVFEATADPGRRLIYNHGSALFWDNLPLGIGYMNYGYWFEKRYGFPLTLHNMYQAWGVETGLPGLGIALILLGRYFAILAARHRKSADLEERVIYKLFAISMISALIIGAFHQIHQSPVFFSLLGLVYSFKAERTFRRKIVWE